MKKGEYLDFICSEIKRNHKSKFSQKVFLRVLKLMPPVPNVPGASVFYELGKKMIPIAVDIVLIKNRKVLLVHRKDSYYDGWHFPGFYRKPYTSITTDCKNRVKSELGGNIKIISSKIIGYRDHIDNHRFHDFGILVLCKFKGNSGKGKWFSKAPKLINIQKEYWGIVEPYLR